jgi:alkylation response protein AidB-like acyl-CoA dehydrogenase
MNFDFTEEQQMVQDSVVRFVQDNYDLEARTALAASSDGFSKEHWATMAELGWLGMPFDEVDGGFGGNQIDTMLIMEQFGKGLVCEPYLASVVLGGGALKRGGSDQLKAEVLPSLIDGSRQLTLAYAEEQARFDLHDVATTPKEDGGDYVINGHKSMVANAASADQIVVSARTSGGQIDKQGISLFLIDADADGVTRDNFPTVDGLRASEVKLENVRVSADRLIGPLNEGFAILIRHSGAVRGSGWRHGGSVQGHCGIHPGA